MITLSKKCVILVFFLLFTLAQNRAIVVDDFRSGDYESGKVVYNALRLDGAMICRGLQAVAGQSEPKVSPVVSRQSGREVVKLLIDASDVLENERSSFFGLTHEVSISTTTLELVEQLTDAVMKMSTGDRRVRRYFKRYDTPFAGPERKNA